MKELKEGISKRKLRIKRVIATIIIMLLIGAIWQKIMVEKETNILLSQGEVFDINNHNMYIHSTGVEEILLSLWQD